ncbi:MAG: radical SAM family heme chaperone HemW [Alphaproteobacteria bacterium]|nr:radical SAM family heme chaperone HemW [Alphaproteobacteria bacterium]
MSINSDTNFSIYLHWPFCLSKCPYCDFMSIPIQKNEELFESYGDLLLDDLKLSLAQSDFSAKNKINSIFFGGGTPSLMEEKTVSKILDFLYRNYKINDNIEISLEANPATFDNEKMKNFYHAGINRISLGIQSFSDDNLRFLGRIYDSNQAKEAAEIVAKIFNNFSFDFMYGYESQNIFSLKNDLKQAIHFGCKHISCYQLTFEEGTLFFNKMLSGNIKKISDIKSIRLYEAIEKYLRDYNIYRYEISNYSKKGFECHHNVLYWKYENYLGVGPSAHGRIRVGNQKHATEKIRDPFLWAQAVRNNKNTYVIHERLTEIEQLEEILIMGLRLVDGIYFNDIYKMISANVIDRVISESKLQFLRENNLINYDREKICLTHIGLLKMDSVIEFLCYNS